MHPGLGAGAPSREPVSGRAPGTGSVFAALALLLALALGCAGSCRRPNESGEPVSNRAIDEVMNAHVGELMAIPGVAGVAIGELDNGTPCITVMVVRETDEIRRRVPRQLEGHPVKIFVSGEIRPMEGGGAAPSPR